MNPFELPSAVADAPTYQRNVAHLRARGIVLPRFFRTGGARHAAGRRPRHGGDGRQQRPGRAQPVRPALVQRGGHARGQGGAGAYRAAECGHRRAGAHRGDARPAFFR
ncbi:hypothetical protein ACFSKM_19755 [Ancylobacter dichloromethanicus]